MSRFSILTNLAFAFITSFAGVGSVMGDQTVPFQASGLRQHVSIEKVQGGLHVVAAIPSGQSNLGPWSGIAGVFIHGTKEQGTLNLDYGAGNTLTVTFTQQWDRRAGDFGGDVGTFEVTGGTGSFAGATGGGAMNAFYLDKKAANVLVVLDGTLVLK